MNTGIDYKRTKYACYSSYLSSAAAFMLTPLLFETFHDTYSISYTLLGTLVLITFATQLAIDLIFSLFSKYFNLKLTTVLMPLFQSLGFLIYALVPLFCPSFAYLGLALGTFVFSISAGLGEVLLSSIIASIPSKTPDRDMSFLHSLYAYGSIFVITVSTLYIQFVGKDNWFYLAIFWAALPLITSYLFMSAKLPPRKSGVSLPKGGKRGNKVGFLLLFLCIFFGGATECTMSSWISSYSESVFGFSKILSDLLGMAMFAIFFGLGRTLYSKYGKNITRVLLCGMIASAFCYIVAALSQSDVISLIACAMTGFSASLLWPGSLILMEEKQKGAGLGAYALMAAGGDLGASVAPQLMGFVVDKVSASDILSSLSLPRDVIGMKAGMLISALFPIFGAAVVILITRYYKKNKKEI